MPFFTDETKLKRQILLDFLRGLPPDLPGVAAAQDAVVAGGGSDPASLIRVAWERTRQQELDRERAQLAALEFELGDLRHTVELYRSGPMVIELTYLRKIVEELSARADAAEQNLASLQETHARKTAYAEQEIGRLQTLVAEQNRIIAKQHLQLQGQAGNEQA